jgi:MFS family permease
MAAHESSLLYAKTDTKDHEDNNKNNHEKDDAIESGGGESEETHHKVTRSTVIFALCAAVNSCNLGYDVGVNTNAGPKIQKYFDLTDVQLELFLGSINFWSMFGALMAHHVTDKYGRRKTFLTAAIGFLVGILIMATAQSYQVLMFGRLFIGLGVGVGLAIDPLYIAEVSPAHARGKLVSWSEVALNVGIVFGFATGLVLYTLEDGLQWRIMLSCGAIMPTLMIYLVLYVMPESPRWLVAQHQEVAARVVLEQIYPPGM